LASLPCSKIREGTYLYVDKTAFGLRLIEEHSYVFLSRPRRFGKSLFVDTLKEIFAGNEELFNGLYIHGRYDFPCHPVIKISFGGDLRSVESVTERILILLSNNAKQLGIHCEQDSIANRFEELIQKAQQKYERRVVVLIDEYDKPILDNIERPAIACDMRELLKSFYGILKENDSLLRFVFLTGVSKFARMSIFSGLNNLDDISLDQPYAALCGYTQEDIDTVFASLLQGVDREKFQAWYNGYNFNGENVYNPFDVLLFISKGCVYRNYWFATGTPGFLIKLLQNKNFTCQSWKTCAPTKALVDSYGHRKYPY